MIEAKLYKISTQNNQFHVIADSYAQAEAIAQQYLSNRYSDIAHRTIYEISSDGYVYYPKTKTITIEV